MHRRRLLATVATAGVVAVGGCSLPGMGEDDFHIGMSANAFRPDEFTARLGEPVRWKNNGSRAHTVTAYEGGIPDGATYFASGGFDDEQSARTSWTADEGGIIHPGEDWEYTFEIPGQYTYFCVPHEPRGMVGEIFIEE